MALRFIDLPAVWERFFDRPGFVARLTFAIFLSGSAGLLKGQQGGAAPAAVLTQHNDNHRTGANLSEKQLNIHNVNSNRFGLLYSRPVDDQVYAQPLVMTNVNVPGSGSHNLLIVATVTNSVYAFDADDGSVLAPYWHVSFLGPNILPVRASDMTGACGGQYRDFSGSMGIVGAPVIDPATKTLYVVARTKENGSTYVQRLHALDLGTGAEQPNSPVIIAANNGTAFDPYKQNQRAGLLLANGFVYITWASHCDWGPYHGWVIGYNATNLVQMPISFNATPTGPGGQAGIWMSNQGPAADPDGNVYVATGNGDFDGVNNFGECFLKLTPGLSVLSVASWFAPFNWSSLNGSDEDLGSGGILLIPGTTLLFSGGKAGTLYLVNRDAMGGVSVSGSDDNIVQSWPLGSHSIHGGPVWWDGPDGSYAYIWAASSDRLRQYRFDRGLGKFASASPYGTSPTPGGNGQPGGILSLSADGTNIGSGIVWASVNTSNNANQALVAGTLHAYDAKNITNELWNSDLVPARDAVGIFPKFVAPTVANGKVYLATFSNRVNVYGLFPSPLLTAEISLPSLALSWPTNTYGIFTLQSTTNLSAANWLNVNHPVVQTSTVYQVTLPATDRAAFYRLKR